VPFVSERSKVARYAPAVMERLGRVALSAMKQSFRAWLPRVDAPADLSRVIAAAGRADEVVVGDQGGERWRPRSPAPRTLVVVGPEAGLSPGEIDALRGAGARLVSVSRHRLRSETAAVALVAAALQGD
jgi:16S rRNA (uracil1498-N3)-methyltransferase